MNYGLYISAGGTLNALYRMDVAANNLANSETAGFKADLTVTKMRLAANPEDGMNLPSDEMLERLGGGVFAGPNRVSWRQGALESTRNDLDVAIEGSGFLRVRSGDGTADGFTRDGRLTINSQGVLVQAASGKAVVDDGGGTISLASGVPVRIDPRGLITQNGQQVGQLALVDVPDRESLRKRGDGFFELPDDQSPESAGLTPATGRIVQRSIERSSVDPVRAMLDISQAERAAGSGSRMIQMHDELMQRAINTFGRLA
jgi:flagellar basal-body rod protein FlgG